MKKFLIFLCIVFFELSLASKTLAYIVTLQPGPEGKDTWIWNNEDFSHGNWGEMRVNDTSANLQYSLIEFDLSLIPSGVTINSALLGLYKYDGYSDAGITIDSHQVTSAWSEDVTWSTQPAMNSAVESSTTLFGNGWYTWDLTSLTQNWVSGTVDNYGVALYDHGSSYYQRLVTGDNATATEPSWALPPTDPQYRPYLKIDVNSAPVPEPSTCLLFLSGLLGMVGLKRKVWKA